MTINKKQIAYNKTKRAQNPVYIVIHDTGNTSKGANANAHFNYFNGGDRQSSADFFVDDTQVLQVNDYSAYYTWHCGDGAGKYGITNANSVGIEICVNSDGSYNTAFANAIELTKQLMAELGIDIDHVVRHYDASRKNCPTSMSADNWALWGKFKAQLAVNQELTSVNDIVWELAHRGIISDSGLWLEKLEQDSNAYWLARKTAAFIGGLGTAVKRNCAEITSVNDIVWEFTHRNIISDGALWLEKLESDSDSYWLARKAMQYIRVRE